MKMLTCKMNVLRNPHPSFVLKQDDKVFFEKVMPERLKLIKLLHHEKMSYQAIAAQTGLSIGTVKSRIYHGRQTILKLRAEAAAQFETYQEPILCLTAT